MLSSCHPPLGTALLYTLGRSDWQGVSDWPYLCPLLCSIFQSLIGLWVEIWHRSKTACSEAANPSTTCQSKGGLLRFELNSTKTSDGAAQKLGNDVLHYAELIATKVCSQIGGKWNVMLESHVVTSIYWASFDFLFKDYILSKLPL